MKKLVILAVCFAFFAAVDSAAEAAEASEPAKKHTFELGGELSYIKYEEPGVMEEKGILAGVSGAYAYTNNYMLKAEGRIVSGEVKYDGRLQDGTPYIISGVDDYIFEIRGLFGWDLPVFEFSALIPYFGFGYRYLNDDTSFDPAGYERESNYFYSPIGIETLTPLNNGWFFGFAALNLLRPPK